MYTKSHNHVIFFFPSNFNIQWPVERQRKQVDDFIQCWEVLFFQNWAALKGIMRQVSIGKCVCKVSVLFGLMGESPGHNIYPSVGSWLCSETWTAGQDLPLPSCFMLGPSEGLYSLQGEVDHFSESIDPTGETCILSPPVWMHGPCCLLAFSVTGSSGVCSTPLLVLLLQNLFIVFPL